MNSDARAAREFHEATNHTRASVRRAGPGLDWTNKPNPFKEYVGLEPLPLPRALDRPLRLGAGVTRTRTYGDGETFHFRAYSSAGALYPVEIYVATAGEPDLAAGLYHFHPRDLALRRLRSGDVRANLAAAAAAPALAEARAVLVLTGIMWRTAWKYGLRGYRHLYWDAGTMLANLLALAASESAEAALFTGFVDAEVNELLGLETARETAVALLAYGRAERAAGRHELEPLSLASAPLSRRERLYPAAAALHEASSLWQPDAVRRYRAPRHDDAPVTPVADSPEELERAILRRGSVREFAREPVPERDLARVLAAAASPIPADARPFGQLHLIANAVAGLDAGAYTFWPPDRFRLLRRGDFRLHAAYLVLEQAFGALSAATAFLTADLDAVLAELGNRGYRWAQLEAGIRVGRIYLAAFARGLGATASTFYDEDVSRFFSTGTSPMLCAAVGRKRSGRAAR